MNSSSNTNEFVATIGLDWADEKHDLWLCPHGGKAEHHILQQSAQAIHEWVAQLRQRFPDGRIAVAIETTRGAIIYALMAYDWIVFYPINPKGLASYRESFKVSGAKDDRTDAQLAEELVRCHRDRLRPLQPQDQLTRTLMGLTEKRRQLVDGRTAAVNQCQAQLKCYYPLANQLLDNLATALAADFLLKWPDLAALKKAGTAKLRNFFYGHNSRSEELMKRRLDALQQARALTEDPAIITPARMLVEALATVIKSLTQAVHQMDQAIAKLMAEHPDGALFESFPGAGPALAPRLLVAFGSDRKRFTTAVEVAQFYGVAPVKRASGKSQVIAMRFRCPKFARQSFHEHAACVVKCEPWAREYYQQLRGRGKSHHAAVRSTAFKLIRIYFRCWKNSIPYNSNIYTRALERHGSPLAKLLAAQEDKNVN
jgi:transposase